MLLGILEKLEIFRALSQPSTEINAFYTVELSEIKKLVNWDGEIRHNKT